MRSVPVGHAEIDAVHAECAALLTAALRCADAHLAAHIDALSDHLCRHFAMEDALMGATDFPAQGCHKDEHAAVLRSCDQVRPLVAGGNLGVGRAFVRAVGEWFPAHATHLDSALATWVCRQRAGAQPLVFHPAGAIAD